jgi:hypothetical protein
VDKALFGIVRHFGLLIALLALIATGGAIFWGIMLYQAPMHQRTIETPKLDYEKYKRSLELSPIVQGQSAIGAEQAPLPGGPTEFQRQFDSYVSEIVTNGNRYLYPDFTMRENVVRLKCKEMTDDFPAERHDSLTLAFVERFARLSGAFSDDPANRENLADLSEKTKRWEAFTSWIVNELHSQIQAENERVQRETAEAVANKAAALQLLEAAGVSFIIFLLFTLILVLLAIERNTRAPLC